MDEINYRRLIACPKIRCEECGATTYEDPKGVYRCVVCDHDRFEICLDCGHLVGWCACPEPVPTDARKKRARRGRSAAVKSKK